MALLRARASGSDAPSSALIEPDNLALPSVSVPNPEHELEVRLEREKEEKSIGT